MFKYLRSFFIMLRAHKGQKDKAGKSYFLHPLRVSKRCTSRSGKIVGLLHDVVEDNEEYKISDFTFLNDQELSALKLLTHDKELDYFTYIENIKTNLIATEVKLSDLNDNSNIGRLTKIEKKDLERVEKYKKAQEILRSNN